jgi:hypothetical protein
VAAHLTLLSPADIELLRELKVAGERGRTIRTFTTRLVLDRLAKDGYVAAHSTGLEMVHYRITRRGQDAIRDQSLSRPTAHCHPE